MGNRKNNSDTKQVLLITQTPMSIIICSLLIAHCSFFISCQTMPVTPDDVLQEAVPLDINASVYIFADVTNALPIIKMLSVELLNDKYVRQMLDRTDTVAIALFPAASGRQFQLAAWGNYPSAFANLAFCFNRNWKVQRTETGRYWYSSATGITVSLNSGQAFAAGFLTGQPVSPAASMPGVTIPEGFGEFKPGSRVSGWLTNPAPVFNSLLEGLNIPVNFLVQQLFFYLYPAEEDEPSEAAPVYEATIRIIFPNASLAAMLRGSLSLANRFASVDSDTVLAAIFFANPPVQNGHIVDVTSARLSENEAAQLLGTFINLLNAE